MNKMFLDSGYLDPGVLFTDSNPFVFVIGARGIGKTYGALKYVYENHLKFVYLRLSDVETQNLSTPAFNPFKTINDDLGAKVEIRKNKKVIEFIDSADPDKKTIGYMFALSTLSNFRSFDLSDVDVIIFDEFIPEANKRPIRNMAETLFNGYESINRNRELKDQNPIRLIALANSNNIFNDVFFYLRITKRVYDMRNKKRIRWADDVRGLTVFYFHDVPISDQKKHTALYKLTDGTNFQNVAIENAFTFQDERLIVSRNLANYKPVVNIGELYIYSNSDGLYYVTTFKRGTFKYSYNMVNTDIASYIHNFYHVWNAYIDNRLFFEDIFCVEVFNMIY